MIQAKNVFFGETQSKRCSISEIHSKNSSNGIFLECPSELRDQKILRNKFSDQEILKKWFEESDRLLKRGKELPRTLFVLDDILVLHK